MIRQATDFEAPNGGSQRLKCPSARGRRQKLLVPSPTATRKITRLTSTALEVLRSSYDLHGVQAPH